MLTSFFKKHISQTKTLANMLWRVEQPPLHFYFLILYLFIILILQMNWWLPSKLIIVFKLRMEQYGLK